MRDGASDNHAVSVDHDDLVYRYAPQLFRLALLVTGNASAATERLEHSYAALPASSAEPEADLIRGLLARRRGRAAWRMQSDPGAAARASLTEPQASALLRLLARCTPAQRLAIGLHLLRGMPADEIAEMLRDAVPDVAGALRQFRLDAAVALGLLPPDAAAGLLNQLDGWLNGSLAQDASLDMRRLLLEDAHARALRDALQSARHAVAQAIPALFAAAPPPELIEDLLTYVAPQPAANEPRASWLVPSLALGAVVLALVAAIIFLPNLRAQTGAATQPMMNAAEIIEAAIHRFDRAPLDGGVLYERYRVQQSDESAVLFERRYDYAPPHRLITSLLPPDGNQPPRAAVSSDGRGLIQYRYQQSQSEMMSAALDVQVSSEEAQATLPLLRNFFGTTSLFLDESYQIDVSSLYLGQARVQGATSLGQTTFLNRSAYLLSYQTDQRPTRHVPATSGPALRVLLTIDRATYALLDVAIIPEGAAEGTASHPWRAEAFEVVDAAPASAFQLPDDGDVTQQRGLASPHAPSLPQQWIVGLAQAQREADPPLLLPAQLPSEAMRGIALRLGGPSEQQTIGVFYEGEFQNLLLLPGQNYIRSDAQVGEERHAGEFRYRLVQNASAPRPAIVAEVFRPDQEDARFEIIFLDVYATPDEREAMLQRIIESLTPVTTQNLPALQSHFPAAEG